MLVAVLLAGATASTATSQTTPGNAPQLIIPPPLAPRLPAPVQVKPASPPKAVAPAPAGTQGAAKPAQAPPKAAAKPAETANAGTFSELYGTSGRNLIAVVGRDASVKATAAAILARQPLPAARGKRAVETATDFKPVGTFHAAERVAAGMPDEAGRTAMRSVLENAVSTLEAAPGFRRNNMAHGLGLLLAVSLQVASGAVLTEAESDRVLAEVNDALVATPAFASLTAERRTALYDVAMVNGAMVLMMWRQAAELRNPEQSALAQSLARDALTLYGLAP